METLHPGLYLQEVAGSSPVEGASTATGAFVGTAPRGDVGKATLVTSWSQFVKYFGGYDVNSYLAYAVRGFFENGGKRAYISRAVHYTTGTKTSAIASATINDSQATPAVSLSVKALNDGVWGNKVSVKITAGSDADHFNVTVLYDSVLVETYNELTMDTCEDETSASEYIVITAVGTLAPNPSDTATPLTGGNDGLVGLTDSDYVGSSDVKNGLYAFDAVTVNLLAIPGITSATVISGLTTYVEGRGRCFALFETPKSSTVSSAKTFRASLASESGALFFPWLKVSDPIGIGKNPSKVVPPTGHIMGVIARTDASQGEWVAPAGLGAKILGIIGLEYNVSDAEQDILNPVNVNCIRTFDNDGTLIWGARTLSSGDYKYIPSRRTVDAVETDLTNGMRWTVFRPNDDRLWSGIKTEAENYLSSKWAQGAFKGKTAKEAFFVKCDSEINTQEVIDSGRTYVDIGLALQKPSEFIIFRLSLIR